MGSKKPVPLTNVLRSLTPPAAESDTELLRRFTVDRDEGAFHAIVRRHGGLVLDVCQAVLRNQADAEDAFQAVFLTLATRATAIRSPSALSAWLHGTAYRIALKARTAAARRRRHEASVATNAETAVIDPSWAEVRQAIHEEVNRLPAAERAAIVHCYLMGRTQDESARSLGLTKDGVKKRLERGREMLRIALMRRGFGAATVLAMAAMPLLPVHRALAVSTTDLAMGLLNGSTAEVCAKVMPLIERGTNMFTATKLLITSSAFAVVTIIAIAITSNDPNAIATAAPRLPEKKDQAVAVKTELDGKWKVVAISSKGAEVGADDFKGLNFTFKNGKLEVGEFPHDEEPAWSPTYLHGSAITIDRDKTPREIDLKLDPKVAKDTTVLGIYQIRKGQLLIGVRTLKTANAIRPRGYATVSGSITSFTLALVDEKDGSRDK